MIVQSSCILHSQFPLVLISWKCDTFYSTFLLFVTKDALGSSCLFLAPALESAIYQGSPSFIL